MGKDGQEMFFGRTVKKIVFPPIPPCLWQWGTLGSGPETTLRRVGPRVAFQGGIHLNARCIRNARCMLVALDRKGNFADT